MERDNGMNRLYFISVVLISLLFCGCGDNNIDDNSTMVAAEEEMLVEQDEPSTDEINPEEVVESETTVDDEPDESGKTENEDLDNLLDEDSDKNEESESVKMYVRVIGNTVNVRAYADKESDALGIAKKNDVFEKIEDSDDWTHIVYKEGDAYIKSEFLTEITEDEYTKGLEIAQSNDGNQDEVIALDADKDVVSQETSKTTTDVSLNPQVIERTFSCSISDTMNYIKYQEGSFIQYEKREDIELKIGDTLNFTIYITNDIGKPVDGFVDFWDYISEVNPVLSQGWIYPGETRKICDGTATYIGESHSDIHASFKNGLSKFGIEGFGADDHGPNYEYLLYINWVK